ncbi:DUF262 domain-containing protein [Sphingomonas sp. OTU376]|uniref:DUF262 domain-containing protein n=1 Tax=Sphingomonas sp. OTU376 TaxID=3043863 RepID=UPI00313B0A1E
MTDSAPEPEFESELAPLDQQEDEEDVLGSRSLTRFDAAISSTDWTTETVISQLRKGNIFLDPDFQRRDAWNIPRKSQYIESLILGIPTPQIILAERRERRGSYIVIDGKQRLLSLRQFAADVGDQEFVPFKLKGLKMRSDLNDQSYGDISNNLFVSSAPDFENATIRTVVIKSWPSEEFLYEVFLRINSGSVQLSPQELRQALHPGPFTTALNQYVIESKVLQDMLGLRHPDFRMRDNEITLRFIAFKIFLKYYNGNLKAILDSTTKSLNEDWENLESSVRDLLKSMERAIMITKQIFGKDAFKKWNGFHYETRINRAVFDVMAYYFSDDAIASLAINRVNEVVDAYKLLSGDWRFATSVSGTTKSVESVHYRFSLWASKLSEVLGTPISSPI